MSCKIGHVRSCDSIPVFLFFVAANDDADDNIYVVEYCFEMEHRYLHAFSLDNFVQQFPSDDNTVPLADRCHCQWADSPVGFLVFYLPLSPPLSLSLALYFLIVSAH